MSPQEFAESVRRKYPTGVAADGRSYTDINDIELTRRWIQANPEYKDTVKLPEIDVQGAVNQAMSSQAVPEGAREIPAEDSASQGSNVQRIDGTLFEMPANRSQMPQVEPKPEGTRLGRVLRDIPSDLQETSNALRQSGAKAGSEIFDVVTDDDFTLAQKFMGVLGSTAEGIAGGLGEAATGLGKTFTTPEAEESLGKLVREAGEAISETQVAQSVVPKVANWYQSLDKDDKLFIDSAGGMAMVIGEMFGVGKAKKPLQAVGQGMRQGGEFVAETAPKVVDWTATNVPAAAQSVYSKVPSMQSVTPNTSGISEQLVAGINRIKPTERQQFKQMSGQSAEEWLVDRGLTGTRQDTLTKLSDNFQALRQNVDEALDKVPGEYKDKRVTVVADEAAEYARSVESGDAGRMASLAEKSKGVGLTTKEINEVKRYYERNIKVGYMKDQTQNAAAVERATNRDGALREYLFEISDQNGFSNLRELNKEIQQSRFLTDKIAGRMEGEGANNVMSLTDWIVVSPGAIDPTFIAGFAGKKLFSTETARSLTARLFSRNRPVKEIPRADLDEIQRLASERMARMEVAEEERMTNFLMARDLQDAGFTMSEGDRAFVTENPIPLTRQEQAMLKVAEDKGGYDDMLGFILEKKAQGFEIGDGFIMRETQEALPAAGGSGFRQEADFNLGSRSQSTIDAQEMERVQSQNRPSTQQQTTNTNSNIGDTDNTRGTLLEQALRLDRDSVQQAISEVEADLSGSTRPSVGENFVQTPDGGAYRFNELPNWIPDNLRSASLMARVLENITNNRKPRANATNEQQLQEIVEERIATRAESLRNADEDTPIPNSQAF